MELIENFIQRYQKEIDFYEKSGRIVADTIENHLRSTGIRAIVTSRAKNPSRLEEKVKQRWEKKSYQSVEDIYKDIVDLAGVRVALYFPGEMEKIDQSMDSLFTIEEDPIRFGVNNQNNTKSGYKKRFTGYWATHYRVRLKGEKLDEAQKRYSEAKVEVQVASVLMHAWSEVEHDLVYKPLQGKLSDEEYAILDKLNGLVLAGEIALERLQKAGELRATSGRWYENHYDLAASLVELARAKIDIPKANESTIGQVDVLYKLLNTLEINTPSNLSKYLESIDEDFEKRTLSEQVINQIINEDTSRYEIYKNILRSKNKIHQIENKESISAMNFLANWKDFVEKIKNLSPEFSQNSKLQNIKGRMKFLGFQSKDLASIENIISIRNAVVHSKINFSTEEINDSIQELKRLAIIAEKLKANGKKPE